MLTILEAAKFLGVSTKTVRRWDNSGELVSLRTIGYHRRYKKSQLIEFQNLRKKKKVDVVKNGSSSTIFSAISESSYPSYSSSKQVNSTQLTEVGTVGQGSFALGSSRFRSDNKNLPNIGNYSHRFAFVTTAIFIAIFITGLISFTYGKTIVNGLIQHKSVGEILSDTKVLIAGNKTNPTNFKGVLADTTSVFDSDLKVNIPAIFNSSVNFAGAVAFQDPVIFNSDLLALNHNLNLGDIGKITASNVIYQLNAGKDISVTAGPCQNTSISVTSFQCPTIDFTGVSSINISSISGQTIINNEGTGAISLLAGGGIALTSLTSTASGTQITITNNDKGSSQNIFKHIKVSNDTIDAGSNDDTLTIVGGTGISFSTDTVNKKFTVSASSSDLNVSGWTDDGTSVRLTTSTDNVGIGTSSPTGKLNVVSITEQLRLGYDANNYWSNTVGATGGLTMSGTGTGGSLTLTPTAGQNLNINLSGTGDLAVNTNQLYVDTSTSSVGIGTTGPGSTLDINNSNPTPKVIQDTNTASVTERLNYGIWDGSNYWIGGQTGVAGARQGQLYKISSTGTLLNTYTLGDACAIPDCTPGKVGVFPLQVAWDGTYIWVGSYDTYGHLVKFNPASGTTIATYTMNPSAVGGINNGGVQGVIWDGSNIWLGIAQNGGGAGAGIVEKIDVNGNVLGTPVIGQTNVNGIMAMIVNGVEYIWAANSGFVSKINTTNYTSTTTIIINSTTGYRLTNDGTYVYVATFDEPSTSQIIQILASNGSIVSSYLAGSQSNTIYFDGKYLWLGGNDNNVDIYDPNTHVHVAQINPGTTGDHIGSIVSDGANIWVSDYSNSHVYKISGYNIFTAASSGTQRFTINNSGNTILNGNFSINQPVATSSGGTPINGLLFTGASHTNLATAEATDINFNLARTVQFATTGGSSQRAFYIQAPTYSTAAGSAQTLTSAATVDISGATNASNSGNLTITTSAALRIEAGALFSNVTNAYGLYVDAPTGAANNYAAVFATGKVGVGITAPNFLGSFLANNSSSSAMAISNISTIDSATTSAMRLNLGTAITGINSRFIQFFAGSTTDNDGTGVGNISLNNSNVAYNTGNADFAEYLPILETVEPGDIIAASQSGNVKATIGQQLLGVVSDTSAFIGNAKENQSTASAVVGLVGQIKTKVSTINGAISIGDPLTSSSTPGVAMKATKAGQIIGKALESYDSSDVNKVLRILVLVNPSWYDPSIIFDFAGDIKKDSNPTPDSIQNSDILSLQKSVQDLNSRVDLLVASVSSLSVQVLQQATQAAIPNNSFDKNLDIKDATISGTLSVLGRTTLIDVGITGDISAGILSIKGLTGEINSLSGPLKLQSDDLSGIEFVGAKVTIDKDGNINAAGEITSKKININTTDVASASLGSGVLKAGQTSFQIPTTAVTDNSKIFITATSATGKQELFVSDKKSGISFMVNLEEAYDLDVKFDWWIIN